MLFRSGNAKVFFNNLVNDKQLLKNIILTPRDKGRILGELFANDEILTLTQVGIVKREMDKPTHTYNSDKDSAWTMYNYITFALKESHPGHYIGDHQKVHNYFVNKYGNLVTAKVDPEDEDGENPFTGVEEVSPAGTIDSRFGVNFL